MLQIHRKISTAKTSNKVRAINLKIRSFKNTFASKPTSNDKISNKKKQILSVFLEFSVT